MDGIETTKPGIVGKEIIAPTNQVPNEGNGGIGTHGEVQSVCSGKKRKVDSYDSDEDSMDSPRVGKKRKAASFDSDEDDSTEGHNDGDEMDEEDDSEDMEDSDDDEMGNGEMENEGELNLEGLDSDENEDEFDEFAEWSWLKRLNSTSKRKLNDGKEQDVAWCNAFIIDRNPIRDKFYTEMEEPAQELSELAFALFDRWGCLKSELRDQCFKKGSGVWGNELDNGKFLEIEYLRVEKDFRRQGIAKKLVEELWETAKTKGCKFALAWGTNLNTREDEEKTRDMSKDDRYNHYRGIVAANVAFWRALGFRRVGSSEWFCLMKDPDHPAHKLSTQDDYDIPDGVPLVLTLPIHDAVSELEDVAVVTFLDKYLTLHAPTDPSWRNIDRYRNTIIHRAAQVAKSKTLMWMLDKPFLTDLLSTRNDDGETPLEALQSALESKRIKTELGLMTVHISDNFQGYYHDEVECLLKMRGQTSRSMDEVSRTRYGCTCGTCIGFMSPRMMLSLEYHADMIHDMLSDALEYDSGPEWVDFNTIWIGKINAAVLQNLKTNKSMRRGLTNLFSHVANCIRAHQLPLTFNVLGILDNAGEWPPASKNFMQRGGTVASVVQAVFDYAIDQDLYLGDGEHEAVFHEDIDKLPKCRNDREFVFVRRQCARLDELPYGTMEILGQRLRGEDEDEGQRRMEQMGYARRIF